jgi:hypothetical protein
MMALLFPILTIVYVLILVKIKISPQKSAFIGMIFLGLAMFGNIIKLDEVAGFFADCAWVLFLISLLREGFEIIHVGKKAKIHDKK